MKSLAFCHVMTYAVLNCLPDALASPKTIYFHRGRTVTLPCNTTYRKYVDWNYNGDSTRYEIYVNGQVDESFPRYSVDYPLVIRNAIIEDEGDYQCVEDAGAGPTRVTYRLIYQGELVPTTSTSTRLPASMKNTPATGATTSCQCDCSYKLVIVAIVTFILTAAGTAAVVIAIAWKCRHTSVANQKRKDRVELLYSQETRNKELGQKIAELSGKCSAAEKCFQVQLDGKEKDLAEKKAELDAAKQETDELRKKLSELAPLSADLKHEQVAKKKSETDLREYKKECEKYRSKCEELEVKLAKAESYKQFYEEDQMCLLKKLHRTASQKSDGSGASTPRGSQKVTDAEDVCETTASPPPVASCSLDVSYESKVAVEVQVPEVGNNFAARFYDIRETLVTKVDPSDLLLSCIGSLHLLSPGQIACVKADSRIDRLIYLLEDCDAELLPRFYEALRRAKQQDVVSHIRKG